MKCTCVVRILLKKKRKKKKKKKERKKERKKKKTLAFQKYTIFLFQLMIMNKRENLKTFRNKQI